MAATTRRLGPWRGYAKTQVKLEMNRAALTAFQLGIADGALETGRRIRDEARDKAPRDPEAAKRRGVPMMADTGHVIVFADGKKVGGDAVTKPRGMRTPPGMVAMEVWFSSPLAHLVELGTIKMHARPFLTPAAAANLPDMGKGVITMATKRVKAVAR